MERKGNNGRRKRDGAQANGAERMAVDVAREAQASRDQLKEAGELAAETARQAQEVRGRVTGVEQQLEGVLSKVTPLRQKQEEAERELEQTLRRARQLLEEVEQVRQRGAEAGQQMEQLRRQLTDTEQHVADVRKDCNEVGRLLLEETRAQANETQRLLGQARADVEAARAELADARRQTQEKEEAAREPAQEPAQEEFPLPPVGAAEETDESTAVVQATVRNEAPAERLLRHLNDAWAVENALVDALQEMSEEVIDPVLRSTLSNHRQVTQRQKEALEGRLRELGKEPAAKRGILSRLFGHLKENWQREPDEYDRTMHHLQRAIATEHFEMAMYQSLIALAEAAADPTTAALADSHLREERMAADELWPFIHSLGSLAPQIPPREEPVPMSDLEAEFREI